MNGVKYYRIKRGLRQKELCRMAGISLFTLGPHGACGP